MKKILGMGNALVDILMRLKSDDLLQRLELPKGSMQLIDEDKMRAIQEATIPACGHRRFGLEHHFGFGTIGR